MIKITKEELLRKKKDLVEKKSKLKKRQLEGGHTAKQQRELEGRIREIQQFIDWINQILQES